MKQIEKPCILSFYRIAAEIVLACCFAVSPEVTLCVMNKILSSPFSAQEIEKTLFEFKRRRKKF
ncbi:MAG: hypothetical protein HXS46_10700 [Theionarchaea archaeon]|nr:hypothetical protein [Theionarchaea archaeon]